MCEKHDRLQVLFSVLQKDARKVAIIFVNDLVVVVLPTIWSKILHSSINVYSQLL